MQRCIRSYVHISTRRCIKHLLYVSTALTATTAGRDAGDNDQVTHDVTAYSVSTHKYKWPHAA